MHRYFCFFLVAFVATLAHAQENKAFTINAIELNLDEEDDSLSFYMIGHAYGKPSNSVYPAPGLLAYVNEINTSDANFLLLLGDNYRTLRSPHPQTFKESFLDQLNLPVLNAVGNHDLEEGGQNYSKYGKLFSNQTYYKFTIGSTGFVVLDSELGLNNGKSNGSIKEAQLKWLGQVIDRYVSDGNTEQLFIAAHKELRLWPGTNYYEDVLPLLTQAANTGVEVYLLSGDMSRKSVSMYQLKEGDTGVTYIHTHLADEVDDKILRVDIVAGQRPQFLPISLAGLPVKSLEQYEYRKISSKTQQGLPQEKSKFDRVTERFRHPYFKQGVALALMAVFGLVLVRFIVRRKAKK